MRYRAPGALFVLLLASSANAVVVPVTPSNLAGWFLPGGPTSCGGPPTGAFTFTPGPGTPPLGSGSLTLSVGSNSASWLIGVNPTTVAGTRLSDITELRYSTYITSAISLATSQQAPRLFLFIYLGDGAGYEQIIFEPRFQTGTHPGDAVPNQGPVVMGAWQTWDAFAGGWWDLNDPPTNPPLTRISTIAAAHPNAVILGGISYPGLTVMAGCDTGDWTNFSGSIDDLRIGVNGAVTQFNFEPAATIPVTRPAVLLLLAAVLAAIAALKLRE